MNVTAYLSARTSDAALSEDLYRSLGLVNTGVSIKAKPASLFMVHVENLDAAAVYVKLYNTAGTPTASDTPLITLAVPASSFRPIVFPAGKFFDTGLGIRATSGLADNNNGAPTASTCIVHVTYK